MLNYLGGQVPSIKNPIPFGLITRPVGAGSMLFQRTDVSYDYAVAGIPFFGGESLRGSYFRRIYQRDLVEITKQQFDNQTNPGEQSLTGWWLRSQSVFNLGEGAQYADFNVDQTLAQRYMYGEHLDTMSTPAQVNLVQTTKSIYTSAGTGILIRGVHAPTTTDLVLIADGTSLTQVTPGGVANSYSMPAGIGTIVSLTDDGVNYYFADNTGVWQGAIGVIGSPASKIWNVPSSSGHNVIAWVKARLMGALDNGVYELAGSGPTLPTAAYEHPVASYRFSSISETPQSIMVAGYVGASSSIYRFDIDTTGELPVLTSGIVTAQMPTGEIINTLYSYVGTFVVIGTSIGFRVATVDSSGDLVYGPQNMLNSNGVQAVTGYDRFVFVGNSENAGIPYLGWVNPPGASNQSNLVRVDLSQTTSTGGYPYAHDLDTHVSGLVTGVTVLGNSTASPGMLAVAVAGVGVYITDTANKEPSGTLYTSRIRFDTLEDKHFKYVYMRTAPISDGSISVAGNNPDQSSPVNLYTQENGTFTAPVVIGSAGQQQEWFALQFTLARGTSNTDFSPTLNGYQLRALPGVNRQFTFTLPLLCFDHEMDKNGQKTGQDGWCQSRLNQLEAVVADGDVLTLQDLNYGVSYQVVIDQYEFQQQANEKGATSSANKQNGSTRGGFVILQARAVV